MFLVGKLGFTVSDKYLKRAGLDYWNDADIQRFNSLEDLHLVYPNSNFYYCTTKTKNKYTDKEFKKGDFFVFGPESRGLNEDLLRENSDKCITIPMVEGQRSLNLSNSVSIVVYEAVRQNGCL